jgi:hypothetical protein
VYGSVVWECHCECGRNVLLTTKKFNGGEHRSCGCIRASDLAGKRFKSLTVKAIASLDGVDDTVWECECTCGGIVVVATCDLLDNSINNCGCTKRRNSKIREENFRRVLAEIAELAANSGVASIEEDETLGISYSQSANRWIAYITLKGKHHYLGKYEKKSDAIAARKKAEYEHIQKGFKEYPTRMVGYNIQSKYNPKRYRTVKETMFPSPVAVRQIAKRRYLYLNYNRHVKRWTTSINIQGKMFNLGSFDNKLAAIEAKDMARRVYREALAETACI